MPKRPHQSAKTDASILVSALPRHFDDWILDGETVEPPCSARTLGTRRLTGDKLLWFFQQKNYHNCGTRELKEFMSYLHHGHESPGGRWGNPRLVHPARSGTRRTYCVYLQAFFRWLVFEEILAASPMDAIATPEASKDQIQPFSDSHIQALLTAAHRSLHPRRDESIVLFLLDTGARASEVCGIVLRDLDIQGRRCVVTGKGDKKRGVHFGKRTARSLWQYLREEEREPDSPLFISDRGRHAGDAMTRSGLLQLIERLGRAAKVDAVRCSPHTFRHTFALDFLRNGGNAFSLQQLLGHTDLKMTTKYVNLAQADLEKQHRQFSPVDHMRRTGK